VVSAEEEKYGIGEGSHGEGRGKDEELFLWCLRERMRGR
jgi:hypothetical protein